MIGFNRYKPFYTNATPQQGAGMQQAKQAAMGWTPPPPPVINNRRQAPAPTAPGGAWGGMLAPNPSAPPVPGLPDPAQMQQTSDQQAGLQKKGSIWDRMARGQGSLGGGMLAPTPSAPPVPGLPDQGQMAQTSDQQEALQKRVSIRDRMVRGQGSLSGGMQPAGGI